jgi:hypothetical protein
MAKKNNNEKPDSYYKAREFYDKAELEISGRYDYWILTLSGSALGISLTFMEKIAKEPSAGSLMFLYLAWLFLAFTLLLGLISFLFSQEAIREQRRLLDGEIIEKFTFTRWANISNWISAFSFTLGIIFLCYFSLANVPINKKESENERGHIEKKLFHPTTTK